MISEIPKLFKQRYIDLVDDKDAFFNILDRFQPRSFRVNTIKTNRKRIKEKFEEYGITLRDVPWYNNAFISEEPDIGSTFEHFLGNIYMQELVSMLPITGSIHGYIPAIPAPVSLSSSVVRTSS